MQHITPLSHWVGFHLFVFALLALELLYARTSNPQRTAPLAQRTAIVASILWIAAALAFALFIAHSLGGPFAIQYLAGYAIEESLSIDNLFVFLLLFRLFHIAPPSQPRVLFWGVAGAILLRGAFIAAGLHLIQSFHWITYLFAAILLFAAIRLLLPQQASEADAPPIWLRWLSRIHPVSLRTDHFFVVENGQRMATVLLLALVAIELTDIVFALDSIPAVLSITHHPFLAYTSNIMAVMGLRSLYMILANLLVKLRYLHFGLAIILAFAAAKMLLSDWLDIGPLVSLLVIVAILATTITLSLLSPPKPAAPALP